jgi:hypothetical protein
VHKLLHCNSSKHTKKSPTGFACQSGAVMVNLRPAADDHSILAVFGAFHDLMHVGQVICRSRNNLS